MGGVGQGEGAPGTVIGVGEVEGGRQQAGNQPAEHILEVDVTLEELANILGEELELPRIQPKGDASIEAEKEKYTGISTAGPESLRHFKRTYRQALRRQIMSGSYDPGSPVIIPVHEDRRYRVWKETRRPERKAVILYMMDVSGSMGAEQKEIVRIESFWIDTWIRSQYKGLETRYIVHDAVAREVDRDTFYRTRESGGTIISSAYKLCLEILKSDYASSDWNIYPFHFSDGDNWSGNDTEECLKLLADEILARVNVFCYGQVESEYGSGQFLKDLLDRLPHHERVITSKISSRDDIYNSIKDFLGKGQ
jgi:uncharacterized sporulation protein YeaH/YhbH (DUF444 family)